MRAKAPGGLTGREFLPVFAKAVRDGDLSSLKLLTTKPPSDELQAIINTSGGRIQAFVVNYGDSSTIKQALQGVEVIVSAMTVSGGHEDPSEALIRAATEISPPVKIYFPSEWGLDYDADLPGIRNPIFDAKAQHAALAESLGLKTIKVAVGAYEELFFTEQHGLLWGLDWKGGVWKIPGDGSERFAFTSIGDIARYTLRAAILALQEPSSVPSRLRVFSENKTWDEYASLLETFGKPVTRQYESQDDRVRLYQSGTSPLGPYYVLQAAAGTPAAAFSHENSHVELLNPGQKYFVPVSFEEAYKKQSS